MLSKTELTGLQKAFAIHYAATLNATEAARQAGYKGNDNTLRSIGSENLTKPNIRAAIDNFLKATTIGPEEVLARLSAQATADIQDFLDPKTLEFDLPKAIAAGKSRLLKKVKVTRQTVAGVKTETVEFELYDAQAALVHLGRRYKLFTDRVQIDDWRSQAIEDIKNGTIQFEALVEAFDSDLATQLFREAGIAIQVREGAPTERS